MMMNPSWSLGMAKMGRPTLKFPESYSPKSQKDTFTHAGRMIRGNPDWEYLKQLREEWDGPLLVKGVMRPDDAKRLVSEGVDGIWVSNHSGRQIEAAPASITQLPKVRAAV